MVALLLSVAAERSRAASRRVVGLAYRWSGTRPDHATIAVRPVRGALGEVFSCSRCARGRVCHGWWRSTARALRNRRHANLDYERSPRDPRRGHGDRSAENELYGAARGDELPEQLRTREAALGLHEAKYSLSRARPATGLPTDGTSSSPRLTASVHTRPQGRRAWLRDAPAAGRQRRLGAPDPALADGAAVRACRRLEQAPAEHASNAAYEAYRARGISADGSQRWRREAQALSPPRADGPDQHDRSRLARGPHAWPPPCRATTLRRRSTNSSSCSPPRSRPSHPTSGISNR